MCAHHHTSLNLTVGLRDMPLGGHWPAWLQRGRLGFRRTLSQMRQGPLSRGESSYDCRLVGRIGLEQTNIGDGRFRVHRNQYRSTSP
jgi:hypothetical protein